MEPSMKKGQAYLVRLGDTERTITVRRISKTEAGGIRYGICLDDNPEVEVDAVRPVSDVLSLIHQGRSWEAGLVEIEDGFEVDVVGLRHEFEVMDPRRKALRMAEGTGDKLLKSQMPGRVIRILVTEGAVVTEGQPVMVVEAMKMENELKSPVDGTVQRICVAEGDQVLARASLIEFE
jgi:biotin carboxyl carrier protein